jgi:hypothetical protein
MKKALLFSVFLPLLSLSSFAQDLRKLNGPSFSKEEMAHYLAYKSRQQRTRAVIALLSGPAITAAGLAVMLKNEPLTKTGQNFGFITCSAGLITTISSVPLYFSSVHNRRKARLLLKNEPTGFSRLPKGGGLTALGIGVNL